MSGSARRACNRTPAEKLEHTYQQKSENDRSNVANATPKNARVLAPVEGMENVTSSVATGKTLGHIHLQQGIRRPKNKLLDKKKSFDGQSSTKTRSGPKEEKSENYVDFVFVSNQIFVSCRLPSVDWCSLEKNRFFLRSFVHRSRSIAASKICLR